jgi:hypothetical protein
VTAESLPRAVIDWLALLDDDQRRQATFDFDDPERFVWAYTPGDREGLALRDMRPDQREAAMRIVGAAASERGAREISDVMALETTLGAIEREQGRGNWIRRDPELYWFAIFGDPGGHAPWMWRVGGHHVAIGSTVVDGQVAGSTPSFLGTNPAIVPSGPRVGSRVLTGEESIARELLGGLSPAARAAAVVDPVAPPDILGGHGRRAVAPAIAAGLRYDELDAAGRGRLERLIRYYLSRATDEVAAANWERAVTDGLAETTFAWAGPAEPGRGHYYAVRGPRLLIEYDNTQNGANHIHAVWRDLVNDWGEDVLAGHYRTAHRPPE